MLALSVAGASLPVIGKRLEPLGGMTAMGVWGVRHAPNAISGSEIGSGYTGATNDERRRDRESTQRGLRRGPARGGVAADLDAEWPAAESGRPRFGRRCGNAATSPPGVHYGNHPAPVLDVWRRKDLPAATRAGADLRPGRRLGTRQEHAAGVCADVAVWPSRAGCAWRSTTASRRTTAGRATSPMSRPPSRGRAPTSTSSAVTAISLRWRVVRPAGICPRWPDSPPTTLNHQAKLPEGADSSVDAVVGIYGRYDWEDRSTPERDRFVDFLERVVVKKSIARHPELFRDASPIARVHRNAPPFLVIHGSKDSVIPVEQARSFVERLRGVSHSMVSYLELPGAGHGFDLIDGERAGAMAHATALFLNQVHRNKTDRGERVI